jgi:type II secretory pathway pseudopilin PulG
MTRFRRLRRWWPVALVGLIALLVYAAWPGRSTFTVSPETTYITEPLDAEGNVDYQTALNERMGRGITPDTNANVLIWQALGPRPEGVMMPPEYFKWLGIEPPPEEGEYFIGSDRYFEAHLQDRLQKVEGPPDQKQPDPQPPAVPGDDEFGEFRAPPDPKQQWNDELDRARKWPWKVKEHPNIADWLKRNEKPLAVAIEAGKRPQYFNPLVSKVTGSAGSRLQNASMSGVQMIRTLAGALKCRAMGRVADGDFAGAWQDLLACQRLGRHVMRSGTLIEALVGMAIVAIATDGEITLLSHGKHSSKQVLAWLKDLQDLPPLPPLADTLDHGERLFALDGLTHAARHEWREMGAVLGIRPAKDPPGDGLWSRLFTRSIDWDPALRNLNRMYDRCAAAWRLPDRGARQQEMAKIDEEMKEAKSAPFKLGMLDRAALSKAERGEIVGGILIGLVVPALQKVQSAADRTEQTQRNLHIAFALAAYRADMGRYPARLDELAPKYLPKVPGDLFSGGPLIYRPTEAGYLLYSVGANGLDEDGRWTDDDPRGDDIRVRMPVAEVAGK